MKKSIKIFLPFILLVILISAASCGDGLTGNSATASEDDTANTVTGSETATEPVKIVPEYLPGSDFEGYEFRILTRDTAHHSMYIDAEEENGESINDAVYKRNRTIEELYNFKIKSIMVSEFNGAGGESYLANELKKTIGAGSDDYDLAMVHMIHAGSLGANKYLADWKDIPHIDLLQPWWDQGAAEGLVINNKLYINSGDFDLDCTDFTWGMIFNKKLWQDFGYEDIYEVVKKGKWTFDFFNNIIKSSTKDLNGDGLYDETDQFGFIAIDRGGLTNFMYGSNERVYQKNNAGGFDFVLNNQRMNTVVEKTYDIYYNNNSTYIFMDPPTAYLPEDQPMNMFMENKGLTASARLAAMPVLRGMEVDFGIIPQPKFDENQNEYYTFSDGHSSMMCIPATVQNPDRFGIIMEALAYSSRNIVLPAYYDIALNTKFTRDEESSEMLDIIVKNRIFDIGYVYNDNTGGLGFIINDLIKAKKVDFASSIEKKEAAALRALEKLIASFE